MDMGSMGGMDTGSQSLFISTNQAIARGYWYGIAGVTGLLTFVRLISIGQLRFRLKWQERDPQSIPSRPRGRISQAYATATATIRELSYAQPIYFTGRISKYFSPLPVGRWLILATYWTVILIFLWSNTILKPKDPMYPYKWEKIGFRAAWVTVAQIPFIYLLSMKFTPLTALIGTSYERINWLHRWAARTVFFTAIVHWSFFLREWWLADFVALEIRLMPMVRYGFGAFGTLTWMVFSGFGFFRAMSYEVFVAQHIVAAAVLIWLLFCHVPAYARYNVWLCVAFISFDWSMRIIWNTLRNTHLLSSRKIRAPGYSARLEALSGDVVRLTIVDADFTWSAGQHAYLTIPRLRPLELHPFTIANATHDSNTLTMLIKARSGFSKSLHTAAVKNGDSGRTYRTLLSGPWGVPPALQQYETVVLIGCASGASFTVPLLEELAWKRGCVRNVTLHWIIRHNEHLMWFEERLNATMQDARASGLSVRVMVHVTQASDATSSSTVDGAELKILPSPVVVENDHQSERTSSAASLSAAEDEKAPLSRVHQDKHLPRASGLRVIDNNRPTVEAMIRPAVEVALGETAVVVCGGLSITAQARTFVAALSDQRAVHKGTGAQGIYLFTETYGW